MFFSIPTTVNKKKYLFTTDWFTDASKFQVAIRFKKFLSKYKGEPCKFLEIGSYEGMSAVWILDNIFTNKDARLWCIDLAKNWTKDAFPKLVENINRSGKRDQVQIIKGSSRDYLTHFQRNDFDFVYIDGDHEAVRVLEDAILAFRITKPGGIIAFDDYLLGIKWPNTPGALACKTLPKKAIDYFLEIYNDKIEILYQEYQIWIKKIKD